MSETETIVQDLTLLLAYLTSWDDNSEKQFGPAPVHRAWKTYDSVILKKLDRMGLVIHGDGNNSMYLTNAGVQRAKEILEQMEVKLNQSS